MSITKMQLASITGNMEQLDQVLLRLSVREDFHQEQAPFSEGKGRGFMKLSGENPYTDLLAQAASVGTAMGYSLEQKMTADSSEDLASNEETQKFLKHLQSRFDRLKSQEQILSSRMELHQNILSQLDHIEGLEGNIDDLASTEFLSIRMGRLPADNLSKLAYYEDRDFVFATFDFDGRYYWGAYFTVSELAPEIDDIFSSLFFEPMLVSDEIHGVPEEARKRFANQLEDEKHSMDVVAKRLAQLREDNRETFQANYQRLKFLQETYELRRYVYELNGTFYILGFIPADQEKSFTSAFEDMEGVKVSIRPADSDERLTAPTKLKNNWLVRPFEMFVDMYGVPSYTDIDPTPFVAITYSLLFGIMFGDVGQGLVISLVGFLMWKWKKMALGPILERIGIVSAFFGLLYGSVFGFEHLLDPMYHAMGFAEKPIEVMSNSTTNILLLSAVALGAVLIVVCIVMNICLAVKQKNWERALLSQNGAAGLIFYGYVLLAASGKLLFGFDILNPFCIVLFIVLPMLVMFLREPLEKLMEGRKDIKPEGGVASYLLESFFELFDVVLSFISNTMSFLRVGGFILSHAGMMAVVATLAEMVGAGASPVVIIIGNLFVMAMEGLIVGIQALRLEFYEIFSRFYEGGGKPFVPISQLAQSSQRS